MPGKALGSITLALLILATGALVPNLNLKIKVAGDYPGPIAPIGPESPPQPIDDEAVT